MDAIEITGGKPLSGEVQVSGSKNATLPQIAAALLAPGRSIFRGVPDLADIRTLGKLLGHMGARVERDGATVYVDADRVANPEAPYEMVKTMRASVLTIDGVASRRPMDIQVIPDRIEAGTLLAAAMITGGDVVVRGARPEDLDGALAKMREAGARISAERGGLRIVAPERPDAVDFITAPFPGFPTDLQAQLMACLTVARGASRVVETVFENRFMHVQELVRMGADIAIDGHTAVVRGVSRLSGAPVMATDLRASASLVLAGLRAEGKTTVHRVYHLDRGYEALEKKLAALGANVRRVKGALA